MLCDNVGIGGKLVGIGKRHTDGSESFVWLDEPVHNKIVSGGLDHLLCYNGQTSGGVTFQFGTWNDGYYEISGASVPNIYGQLDEAGLHFGIFKYLGIGSDGSPTDFYDSGLHEQIGQLSSNPMFDARSYCWTEYSDGSATLYAQACYSSNTVATASTVREFALFGSVNGPVDAGGTPVMFARVALDQPLELEAGEAAIIAYRLAVSIDTKPCELALDGMTDIDGAPLRAVVKRCTAGIGTNHYRGSYIFPFPSYKAGADFLSRGGCSQYTIGYSGRSYTRAVYGFIGLPFHRFPDGIDENHFIGAIADPWYATEDLDFPEDNGNWGGYGWKYIPGGVNDFTPSFVDYHGVGNNDKHRDLKYVIGPSCPSSITTPDSYVDIHCMLWRGSMVRFGYEEDAAWHPQALRKDGQHSITLVHRTRYSTPDTL